MTFASLFAGIGGFDLALERLGHECVFANDFNASCKPIYDKHFAVKLDTRSITDVPASDIPDHDILCGGFPCQAFSIAGRRGGFDDTRGTLFFDIARIARAKRPAYLFLENVKGLLSHDHGRTFETIVRALDELGYDCQWQVVNSADFGVPHNRPRIIIIGNLREIPQPAVFPLIQGDDLSRGCEQTQGETVTALRAKAGGPDIDETYIQQDGGIRRLTSLERERLQGFPDGWTEGIAETRRWSALGNAVTVNVIYEIAKRAF